MLDGGAIGVLPVIVRGDGGAVGIVQLEDRIAERVWHFADEGWADGPDQHADVAQTISGNESADENVIASLDQSARA